MTVRRTIARRHPRPHPVPDADAEATAPQTAAALAGSATPVHPSAWQIAESFRRTVLYLLAAGAMAMGALLGLTAPGRGPSFALLAQLPGWPWLYGLLLFACGSLQLLGVLRNWRFLSVIGCASATAWYLGFAGTFVATWIDWVMGPQTAPNPSIYPVAPYAMIGSLHVASVEVLFRYWRAARREVRTRPHRTQTTVFDVSAAKTPPAHR